MERSSFFNAELRGEEYDRVYLAEDYARYFASFIGNGVFPNPSSNLQVVADGITMNFTLKQGKAWIKGYFYENTEDLKLSVDVADGVLNRIDRVVVRLDFINREIKAYVKKGAFATSPVPPSLTRNADIYELGVADIKINKGVTKIVQADITDLRQNNNYCGLVAGVVQQIDTTNLFAQFQSSFDLWFDHIKDQLSEDVAGDLQLQINEKFKDLQDNKATKDIATTSANGLMSSADKSKLNGIAAGANAYTHPSSHPATMITEDVTHRFVTDTEKNTWNGKASTANATQSANGLMSNTDKTKLDGVATNANNYTHPSSHPASIITQDATYRFVSDAEKNTWNLTTNFKDGNGYVKLPNGLILQWGRGTLNNGTSSTGFNFATKFPTSCLSATAAVYDAGNTSAGSACRLTGFSVTSISVANSIAMANNQVTYFAIGY